MKHVIAALAGLATAALAAPVVARKLDPAVDPGADAMCLVKVALASSAPTEDRTSAAVGVVGGVVIGALVFGLLEGVSA